MAATCAAVEVGVGEVAVWPAGAHRGVIWMDYVIVCGAVLQ